jgi:phage terminase small subunit
MMYKFVEFYIADPKQNATQAAKDAGYSPKTAYAKGSSLLKDPRIQELIAKARLRLESKSLTPEKLLESYLRDINFDPRRLYDENGVLKDVTGLDDDTAMALAGADIFEHITEDNQGKSTVMRRGVKYKFPDKRANRDSVARMLGYIHDNKITINQQFATLVTVGVPERLPE